MIWVLWFHVFLDRLTADHVDFGELPVLFFLLSSKAAGFNEARRGGQSLSLFLFFSTLTLFVPIVNWKCLFYRIVSGWPEEMVMIPQTRKHHQPSTIHAI